MITKSNPDKAVKRVGRPVVELPASILLDLNNIFLQDNVRPGGVGAVQHTPSLLINSVAQVSINVVRLTKPL